MLDVKKLERLIRTVQGRRTLYAATQAKFQEVVAELGYQGEQFQTAENRLKAYIMELSGEKQETLRGKNGEGQESDPSGSGECQEES